MATEMECECGEAARLECARCKVAICDDVSCGQETVDGYLCGSYTQGGCSKNYTTCDLCQDDEAIHEAELGFCEDCGNAICEECAADSIQCEKCDVLVCDECMESHGCEALETKEATKPDLSAT